MSKLFLTLAIVAGIATILISCSGSKKVAKTGADDEVKITMYCSGPEFQTSAKAFRFSSIGISMDQMTSKNKALSEARAGLAAEIQTKVKRVMDNYVNSREHQNKEDLEKHYEGRGLEVVNQTLNGAHTICEQMTKTKDGTFRTYICMELGGPELLGSLNNRLSKDEMLKVDYDYEKFKKTFEEEMNRPE